MGDRFVLTFQRPVEGNPKQFHPPQEQVYPFTTANYNTVKSVIGQQIRNERLKFVSGFEHNGQYVDELDVFFFVHDAEYYMYG
jgi:hypothetical protein